MHSSRKCEVVAPRWQYHRIQWYRLYVATEVSDIRGKWSEKKEWNLNAWTTIENNLNWIPCCLPKIDNPKCAGPFQLEALLRRGKQTISWWPLEMAGRVFPNVHIFRALSYPTAHAEYWYRLSIHASSLCDSSAQHSRSRFSTAKMSTLHFSLQLILGLKGIELFVIKHNSKLASTLRDHTYQRYNSTPGNSQFLYCGLHTPPKHWIAVFGYFRRTCFQEKYEVGRFG